MASRGIVVDPSEEEPVESTSQEPESTEPTDSDPDESQIPEKFRGKSVAEIVSIYENAEQELGRLRNDLGATRAEAQTWRSLVDELGEARRKTDPKPQEPEIDSDALLKDPKSAITTLLDSVLEERLGPVVKETTKLRQDSEAAQFVSDYPNYVEVGNSKEFQEFVAGSTRRVDLARKAIEKNDIPAMRELMEGWEERQQLIQTLSPKKAEEQEAETDSAAPTGVSGARKVATESPGSGGATRGKKVFRQNEVIKVMLQDPDKYYSEPYQKELMAAMRDGRFKS